jgi:hypothetical protein
LQTIDGEMQLLKRYTYQDYQQQWTMST